MSNKLGEAEEKNQNMIREILNETVQTDIDPKTAYEIEEAMEVYGKWYHNWQTQQQPMNYLIPATNQVSPQQPAESGSGDEFISDEEEMRQIEKQNRYNAGFVEACKIAGKEIESLKSQLTAEREKNARVVEALKRGVDEENRSWKMMCEVNKEFEMRAPEKLAWVKQAEAVLQQSGSSMQPEGGEKQDI